MKKSVKVLLFLLCAVLTGVFLFSGYKLYSIYAGYRQSARQFNDLADKYVTGTPAPTATPFAAPEQTAGPAPVSAETAPSPAAEVSPIRQDVRALQAEYPDGVGWLYSPDTVITYPIVRSSYDNPDAAEYYYLYRAVDGSYSGNGTPFMDCRNSANFSDYNTIVYGHHMNDGSMFASLDNYRNPDGVYLSEHPVMYLRTPERDYKIELFAGYVCDADSNTYTMYFPDESSFLIYCRDMKAKSDFRSDVEVQPGDCIITLSTCSYEWHDARYVVQGRLVPMDSAVPAAGSEFTVSAAG